MNADQANMHLQDLEVSTREDQRGAGVLRIAVTKQRSPAGLQEPTGARLWQWAAYRRPSLRRP